MNALQAMEKLERMETRVAALKAARSAIEGREHPYTFYVREIDEIVSEIIDERNAITSKLREIDLL